jgi:hypothetical protein
MNKEKEDCKAKQNEKQKEDCKVNAKQKEKEEDKSCRQLLQQCRRQTMWRLAFISSEGCLPDYEKCLRNVKFT